jgi:hypothetical protein
LRDCPYLHAQGPMRCTSLWPHITTWTFY